MPKQRLDIELVRRGLVISRSQAESYIKLGQVKINGQIITKSGYLISENDHVALLTDEQYVSRAALKLKSVVEKLGINFQNKIVLDVGSSTGGFTDFALQHGAKRVIAVDVGTKQLHPSLLTDERIELHEQTDIRSYNNNDLKPDIILIDVSFISLQEILPKIKELSHKNTEILAMVKPQFESGEQFKHKGVVKNEKMRRQIMKQFEERTQKLFVVVNKADSAVSGEHGNRERFYLLKKL